jgi:hypothetical protein
MPTCLFGGAKRFQYSIKTIGTSIGRKQRTIEKIGGG